jgi:hypothetical protein
MKSKTPPLFPLEDFADLLCKVTTSIGEDPRFISLSNRVDELLSARASGRVAAEKCRQRAIAYFEAGQYLLAIKQLHQAKIKWFSAETLWDSLLAMLTLSDCYQNLGLVYAAKYYAPIMAYLAFHHDQDGIKSLLPRALFSSSRLLLCCRRMAVVHPSWEPRSWCPQYV